MARLSAPEFKEQVRSLCADSLLVVRVAILTESFDHVQIRVFLRDQSFIDIYHHELSGKTSFAQILDDRRIFGADNKGGLWHWHPRLNPSQHVASEREISFEEFLKEMEKTID